MDAVDASYYPFVGTQILDAQGNGAGMEHGNIFTAIKHGDRDTAKAWGGQLPAQTLKHSTKRRVCWVIFLWYREYWSPRITADARASS